MNLRAILFDKDGTLVNFDATWRAVYLHVAAELARDWGDDELARPMLEAAGFDFNTGRCAPTSALACGTGAEIAQIWAASAGRSCPPETIEKVDRLFAIGSSGAPVPAVDDLDGVLANLSAAGYRLGVATMDSEASAKFTLERLQIAQYFEFVCGYDSGNGHKPDAGMLKAFCNHLNLVPAQVAMVGDTTHDLHMGRAGKAGLVVGVLTGAGDARSFAGLADWVLDDIGELPSRLGRSDFTST